VYNEIPITLGISNAFGTMLYFPDSYSKMSLNEEYIRKYTISAIEHNQYVIKNISAVILSGKIKTKMNTTISIKGHIHLMSALQNICTQIESIIKRLQTIKTPITDMNQYYAFIHAFYAIPVFSKEGYLLESCKYLFIKPSPHINAESLDLTILHNYVNSISVQTGGNLRSRRNVYDFSKNNEDFTNLDLTEDPEGENAHLYRYSIFTMIDHEIYTQLARTFPTKSKDELAYLTEDISNIYTHLVGYVGMPSYDSELIAYTINMHEKNKLSDITYTEFETLYFNRKEHVNQTHFGEVQFPFEKYMDLYNHIMFGTPYMYTDIDKESPVNFTKYEDMYKYVMNGIA
jgi:hypothetical protein